MVELPRMPDVPAPQRIHDTVALPLEDLSARGLVKLGGLARALEQVCWYRLMSDQPVSRIARHAGLQASLSRLAFDGQSVPVRPETRLEAAASFQYGHTIGPDGRVERRLLRLSTELRLPEPPPGGATDASGSDADASRVVGRIHTEHLLTAVAPNGETPAGLEDFAFPDDGGTRFEWTAPSQVFSPPPNARRLEREARVGRTVVFGPMHTDPRGRVRSLAFPRIFEEVALERFAGLGQRVDVLAREVHLTYRKPCIAGQRVDVTLQAFERDGTLYAVGAFMPQGLDRRPHCYVRMGFG
jgi:hypothetical protein